MGMIGVKIESDFLDYYDYLSSNRTNSLVYKRHLSDLLSKDRAIGILKRLKLKTITIGAVKDIAYLADNLVVYTDIKSGSKRLMASKDALLIYPNYLASIFYEESDGITYKILQIGDRRFRIILKGDINTEVKVIESIEEIFGVYHRNIRNPIFSIDFIPTNSGLLALDINNVEVLKNLGMYNILTAEEVISQIYRALRR